MLVIRVLVACVSVLVASPAAAPPRPVGVTGGIAGVPVEVCEYENVNLGAPFAISQHAPDGFIVAEAADDFVLVDPDDPDGINACLLDQVTFAVEMQFVGVDPSLWESVTVTIYQDRGEVCAAQQLDVPCQRNPDKGPCGYPVLENDLVEPLDCCAKPDDESVACELTVPMTNVSWIQIGALAYEITVYVEPPPDPSSS